jgi:hypothetical protein
MGAGGGADIPHILARPGNALRLSPRLGHRPEIGDSWRAPQTLIILSLWAASGLLIAKRVLARMARRQSESQVAAARHEAAQWVR